MPTTQYGKQGWTPARIEDLNGKTFVITGANTGAGFEASRILLSKGAEVVMLNRNEQKSNKAIADLKGALGASAKVSFIKMDLSELASVGSAAADLNKTLPKIDALMCNAAIAQVPKQTFTTDGFESQLGVNHYGHFLLCGLLYEKVEQSNGRIVVVGSEGYKMGIKTIQFDDMNWDKNYHPMNTYCHSKLAQIMFAYELQDRIKAANKDVQVYVCHPGASATSLIKNSGGLKDRILFGLMSMTPLVQSAERGAYPEVMCATEAEENLNEKAYYGPTGRMQWTGPVGKCKLEPHAQDKAVATTLWTISEKETNFKWNF
ncbi:MAG: SDR family oxidoreductase [Saprospiraceae bacterium]|nr:SDR family oxidoreductase [Saprospiraceae bacterium]